MRTEKEAKERFDNLLSDEIIHYKPATVFENAPRALIQLQITTELRTLAWAYGFEVPKLMTGNIPASAK